MVLAGGIRRGDEDVRRLHVAMDEPSGVGGVERVAKLSSDRRCPNGASRPPRISPRRSVPST